MKRHAARIHVSEGAILHWLDFVGGTLHFVGRSEDRMDITFVIEHPDMPETKEAQELLIVEPAYREYKSKRVFPKKHNPLMRLLRKFF